VSQRESPLRDRQLHVPGQSLDEAINRLWDDRGLAYFTYAMGFIGLALWEWLRWFSPSVTAPWLTTVVAALVVGYCVRGLFRLRRQTDQLKLGRDGERAVAEVLDGLRAEGCIVYHDVVGNGFNVDHVVVSRAGVFVVETKTISKPAGRARKVSVSMRDGHLNAGGANLGSGPLEQAKASAGWVYRILKESTGRQYPVKPCLVFPGWYVEEMDRDTRRDLWVLNPKGLASFITNESFRLREEDVHLAALHLAMYIRSPGSGEDSGLAKKVLASREKHGAPGNAA
jgi:Nuclease-related domain